MKQSGIRREDTFPRAGPLRKIIIVNRRDAGTPWAGSGSPVVAALGKYDNSCNGMSNMPLLKQRSSLFTLAACGIFAAAVFGQTASITGAITDPKGAAVPGATV